MSTVYPYIFYPCYGNRILTCRLRQMQFFIFPVSFGQIAKLLFIFFTCHLHFRLILYQLASFSDFLRNSKIQHGGSKMADLRRHMTSKSERCHFVQQAKGFLLDAKYFCFSLLKRKH